MKVAVIIFPGSNCDRDCINAVTDVLSVPVTPVWHENEDLSSFDTVILPGGFSYGDYLRTGAIARFSPIMRAVTERALSGKLILGICNGFQILLEAGLLPGAMLPNQKLKYICCPQKISVENNESPFTNQFDIDEVISIPIAHQTGNYFCDEKTLQSLQRNQQILFKYAGENPNGSLSEIAGICNKERNILGMMPHPERAITHWMGSEDGVRLFKSIFNYWKENYSAT